MQSSSLEHLGLLLGFRNARDSAIVILEDRLPSALAMYYTQDFSELTYLLWNNALPMLVPYYLIYFFVRKKDPLFLPLYQLNFGDVLIWVKMPMVMIDIPYYHEVLARMANLCQFDLSQFGQMQVFFSLLLGWI